MGREILNVEVEDMLSESANKLPLLSLNHVSFVCKSVKKSVQFYEQVLGFVLIKRPSSFDFKGAWLFNHGIGIGIYLLEAAENVPDKKEKINPKDTTFHSNAQMWNSSSTFIMPLLRSYTTLLQISQHHLSMGRRCSTAIEMLENLAVEMMDISI
ncbi:Lactoylglutathione lyase/glyoxalase I family protein [Abeliophyllum distichum]|uniref:Lactoylglutathione lyase/glyoxalase I family protein n=1 Tax=Abeliophyllum distichum TaxID=126358 RepID=A0ABD1TGF1_9LAMI